MNKSESKYYNTALAMNTALISLLNIKDYDFITIKEVCEKAGVNRSTFYLHYETMDDLLSETIERINKTFMAQYDIVSNDFVKHIPTCPIEDLLLLKDEYLRPYLEFLKRNKLLYKAIISKPKILGGMANYKALKTYVFYPLFERFHVQKCDQDYVCDFFLIGVNAIIKDWINKDCLDDIDHMIQLIQSLFSQLNNPEIN